LQYTIHQIADIVKGRLTVHSGNITINNLAIDSRKLNAPVTSLFFAIITQRNDGHKYIADLIGQGVSNFCVSYIPAGIEDKANFILVGNTLQALQDLAAAHRHQFSVPVIGITGSNGKTIVKEWLWQLLAEEKTIVRSPQSFNSQVGVPLSVWQMSNIHDIAIFEAGISQPGEMEKLESIIKPDIGIITNIGHAHDVHFESAQQKTSEKLRLFDNSRIIIYCRDAAIIHEEITRKFTGKVQPVHFTWGYNKEADVVIVSVDRDRHNTFISATYQGKHWSFSIPFTDDASFENVMHCWSVMLLMGYGPEVTARRMSRLQPVAMRLEMKEGVNGCLIINDTYSSDPDSLAKALDFLLQQSRYDKKTVIISDMLESSMDEDALYSHISELLSNKQVNRIIGIGEVISRHDGQFRMNKQFFKSTEEFLSALPDIELQNESILIKGARVFAFERIIEKLQQKLHETVLEVNLSSLIHNLNYFRSLIRPETKVMAMVKAFSYGSGSFEIANILQFHHVDYLGVAYADEGVELRKAGISLPIMVMNPEMTGMDAMIRYNLEPEIYSFRTLELFARTFDSYDRSKETTGIHLKLDTGMHRLGFMEDEIERLAEELKKYPRLRVSSAFSHLAASESIELDDFTNKQLTAFERMTAQLQASLDYPFMRHTLNSAGIIRHPQAQFDMVRLGISLYGISALDSVQDKLEVVSSLKSVISQIKKIKKNEPVGYSCKWVAPKDSTIAIVPIGYADGLSRKLSNGVGKMYVNGMMAPIVGNINMDMTVLDITGINAEEGDEVIVFGREIPISDVASQMETIPYELLTGISRRVKRIYYQE